RVVRRRRLRVRRRVGRRRWGPVRAGYPVPGALLVLPDGADDTVEPDDTGPLAVRVVEEHQTVAAEQLEAGTGGEDLGPGHDPGRVQVDHPDLAAGVVRHEHPVGGLHRGTEVVAGG